MSSKGEEKEIARIKKLKLKIGVRDIVKYLAEGVNCDEQNRDWAMYNIILWHR